ncbi:uncharacterized protein LOC117173044 isoform X1 [Belonocnema kinseyi]|uniref:uncharacterized protein LOC117173044 isoform X1 n=1 Tax=Belonocnema kinseyi TaxID=2817044 RepID=UPI00143DBBAD|nr:uncharacterized protein LOC117173044 isoform X1 [Belonocnema kinseyi]
MKNGFLLNVKNISFSWYTDGVPIFKSSKVGFWPLYLTINEFPYEIRFKKKTILAGLWFGNKKPNANYFVYKFRQQFENIFHRGIQIELPNINHTITVRGVLLRGACDLPAKAQFLNFVQFNSENGCPTCHCTGEQLPLDPRGSVRVYPYVENPRMRTTEECITYGDNATSDNPVMGIKGPNAFSRIMPDFMREIGIDKMHSVDGGIVKKIINALVSLKIQKLCIFVVSIY